MKRNAIVFLCMFVIGAGIAFAADPAEGFWLSVDDKTGKVTAGWEIYQQGGKLFGKVLSTADHQPGVKATACKESYKGFPLTGKVNQMNVAGTPWIFGLSMDKVGQWKDGNVIDPSDGKMYKCKIIFHPRDGSRYKTDTLEMRGEIGLGIGRSQYWQKTTQEEAANLRP
ncbi:MAG: DUF2147 domain-containing protein [Treponema sp.]|jgi:uncharacterized protein (DUF2147 family)|nr:DUF2147 domain-containing protein [Treponema sp.]